MILLMYKGGKGIGNEKVDDKLHVSPAFIYLAYERTPIK
jgi:hypothetical protein